MSEDQTLGCSPPPPPLLRYCRSFLLILTCVKTTVANRGWNVSEGTTEEYTLLVRSARWFSIVATEIKVPNFCTCFAPRSPVTPDLRLTPVCPSFVVLQQKKKRSGRWSFLPELLFPKENFSELKSSQSQRSEEPIGSAACRIRRLV